MIKGFVHLVLCGLALGFLGATGAADDNLGMITSIEGTVEVKVAGQANWKRPATMAMLRAGDVLRTGKRSAATVILFADGHRERILQQTTATMQASTLRPEGGAKRLILDTGTAPTGVAQACVVVYRSREMLIAKGNMAAGRPGAVTSRDPMVLRSPLPKAERTIRPTFSWDPYESAGGYRVQVVETFPEPNVPDKPVFARSLRATSLPYPADEPALRPDASYRWSVAAIDQRGREVAKDERCFRVLDEATLARLQREEAPLKALAEDEPGDTTGAILLAHLYEGYELFREAIPLMEGVARSRPEDPAIVSELGDLFEVVGWAKQCNECRRRASDLLKKSPDMVLPPAAAPETGELP